MDCARHIHKKRTTPVPPLPPVILPPFLDAGSLFQMQMRRESHLHSGLCQDKKESGGHQDWDRNLKVQELEKQLETRISRENGDSRSRKKKLVNQWVMVDKSNWREDKEARTGRAGTKRLDIKRDRFINQWGAVGKSICSKDEVVRTRGACTNLNKEQEGKLETQLEWELQVEMRRNGRGFKKLQGIAWQWIGKQIEEKRWENWECLGWKSWGVMIKTDEENWLEIAWADKTWDWHKWEEIRIAGINKHRLGLLIPNLHYCHSVRKYRCKEDFNSFSACSHTDKTLSILADFYCLTYSL